MIPARYMFALRIAISTVIAAGLSLSFGWERPMWAMFGVMFCALGDEGESLHKGTMRLLATCVGGGLSLIFTALFSDHRWQFGGAVMAWVLICVYMMQDNRRWYVWFHAAFLTILMPIYSAEEPARAFLVVMLRFQETALGVLIYTVIANVVLPDRSRKTFIAQLGRQVAAVDGLLSNLARAYRRDAAGVDLDGMTRRLRSESVALHTNFRTRLDAAVVENFDLLENRDAWRRIIDELEAIIRMSNRLRLSLADVHADRLRGRLPDIAPATEEIARRMSETAAILGGSRAFAPPRRVETPQLAPPGDGRPFRLRRHSRVPRHLARA